ncbi:MAG TPA: UDP-3-O-(3-hydroxymyristoyl)glucosamine N-acyltransferase [Thermoanaerobaculia bacterium]|nr:UDP-3-O-(3-hydroxymyristoyl)glucosamine N-acyltransferase [Thermoanaerobaculia bacterium]
MPSTTAGEIADLVEGEFRGDRSRIITGARSLSDAGSEDLSFLGNARYQGALTTTRAGVVLVNRGLEGESDRWIRVADPYFALATVLGRFFSEIPGPRGISPQARIDSTARLGQDVSVGAFASIGADVMIEDGVTIHDGVVIGEGVRIGQGARIYPNCVIYHHSLIGSRCILQAGVVIGSDGFGFATRDGRHHKIPQIGIVRIEDDVDIGAGTTIDRAALGETVIGAGTKIDNLVQIGHNVKIGKGCLIVAQVGIAGSTEIGDYCVFAGHSGASGHLRLGNRVMVGAKSAVMKDYEGPVTLAGTPARPLREHLKSEALSRKLPDLFARVGRLEKSIASETPMKRENNADDE